MVAVILSKIGNKTQWRGSQRNKFSHHGILEYELELGSHRHCQTRIRIPNSELLWREIFYTVSVILILKLSILIFCGKILNPKNVLVLSWAIFW